MQTLRNATHIARLVLVWFVVSMGVAIASPMVKPQEMQLICTGSGSIKVVTTGDNDASVHSSHSLDCPLCANVSAPPPATPAVLAHAPQRSLKIAEARHVVPPLRAATPPPARGPPATA